MSASRHTYGVSVRGVFTLFDGSSGGTQYNIMYGDDGIRPACFGSKREAIAYAARFNAQYPSEDGEPNYRVVQLR